MITHTFISAIGSEGDRKFLEKMATIRSPNWTFCKKVMMISWNGGVVRRICVHKHVQCCYQASVRYEALSHSDGA